MLLPMPCILLPPTLPRRCWWHMRVAPWWYAALMRWFRFSLRWWCRAPWGAAREIFSHWLLMPIYAMSLPPMTMIQQPRCWLLQRYTMRRLMRAKDITLATLIRYAVTRWYTAPIYAIAPRHSHDACYASHTPCHDAAYALPCRCFDDMPPNISRCCCLHKDAASRAYATIHCWYAITPYVFARLRCLIRAADDITPISLNITHLPLTLTPLFTHINII